MFGRQVLDVAVGLIFIFLLLSLAVTALNELVAAWLKRRPAMLWKGVVKLLGSEAATKVRAHPLVSSLSQTTDGMPSYIPSHTFVLALLDGLTPPGALPPATVQEVAAALKDELNNVSPEQKRLATMLGVLLQDASGNMEEFKKSLELWFDNSMERVSGWYKRETQWILGVMAIVITVWVNADSLKITNTLWRDPAVRSALAAQAQAYAKNPPATALQATNPPTTTAQPPTGAPDAETAKFNKTLDAVLDLSIPLGWKDSGDAKDTREAFPALADIPSTVQKHVVGWLLTALAISLGAPFWFDMLNRVISIRMSGKAPEEKPVPPREAPALTAGVAAGK
jgi:hypothetical protein